MSIIVEGNRIGIRGLKIASHKLKIMLQQFMIIIPK